MEIIHLVLGKANPERMNGVNKVVFQLASEQVKAGKEVSVWGITKDLTHNYGERPFKTLLFMDIKNPFSLDGLLSKALLEKKGNIVVHLHGGWVPQYIGVGRFLRKHGIPYVITPHGAYNTVAMQRSALFKKCYFAFFEKQLLKGARRIHSIGASEVQGLAQIYPNNQSFLLPYGFQTNSSNDTQVKPQSEHFVVGFVGRIDIHTKGLDLLLSAFGIFRKKAPEARLWIVGDGPELANLRQMADNLGLAESIQFHGSKFGEEKNELLRQMDIFVHPSRNEGLPVAVLEASYFGVPSVVTEATNVAEYIQQYQAGKAIPNEDIPSLEAAFMEFFHLWQKQGLQDTSLRAKQMVEEVFGWERLVQRFDELYFGS